MKYEVKSKNALVIKNSWDNGTIVEIDLKINGDVQVFFANRLEINEKRVSPESKIEEGSSVSVIEKQRKNIVAINKSEYDASLEIDFSVSPPLPFVGPTSATSGF